MAENPKCYKFSTEQNSSDDDDCISCMRDLLRVEKLFFITLCFNTDVAHQVERASFSKKSDFSERETQSSQSLRHAFPWIGHWPAIQICSKVCTIFTTVKGRDYRKLGEKSTRKKFSISGEITMLCLFEQRVISRKNIMPSNEEEIFSSIFRSAIFRKVMAKVWKSSDFHFLSKRKKFRPQFSARIFSFFCHGHQSQKLNYFLWQGNPKNIQLYNKENLPWNTMDF